MNELLSLYQLALPQLLKGAWITVQISFASLCIGGVIGACLGVVNSQALRSPLLGSLMSAYVGLIRGTPLFVQVLIVYFGLPTLLDWNLSPLQAGVIALGLNSAAYLSEIVRGGINALPKGQWEACYTLGYSKIQAIRFVILPQAAWNIAPAIVNEMISLVKESSILLVVGVPELTKVSKDIVSHQLKPMEIYLLCAGIYLIMTSLLHVAGSWVERRKPWAC